MIYFTLPYPILSYLIRVKNSFPLSFFPLSFFSLYLYVYVYHRQYRNVFILSRPPANAHTSSLRYFHNFPAPKKPFSHDLKVYIYDKLLLKVTKTGFLRTELNWTELNVVPRSHTITYSDQLISRCGGKMERSNCGACQWNTLVGQSSSVWG